MDSKKELLMRIVVVALAFTLTVSGIVYLTKALLGDTQTSTAPQVAQTSIPVTTAPQTTDDPMAENSTTTEAPASASAQPPAAATPPAGTPPVAAPAVTTPPATPPAATTPPVTRPVAATPPASGSQTAAPTPIHVSGTYVIQFSSFRSEENAKNEARKFLEACADMYVTKVELANGIWYRVRGCNTDTRQAAESMKAEIKTRYNMDTLVVNVQ